MPKHTHDEHIEEQPHGPNRLANHALEHWWDTDKKELYVAIGTSFMNQWKLIHKDDD